jgi:hypothetical protein
MPRPLLVIVLAVLVSAAVAAPAQALDPFGPPVQILSPGCSFTRVTADVVQGGDGLAHGFVTFSDGSCAQTPIRYFQAPAARGPR